MSTDDVDEAFRAQAVPLISRLLHTGAYHPFDAAGPSRDLAEILDSRDRIEYACWTIARTFAAAGAALGGTVNVLPGVPNDAGQLVEGDIDAVAPGQRAAVRFLRAAVNGDPDTGHAVFLSVPNRDVPKLLRSIIASTITVVRTAGWGAH